MNRPEDFFFGMRHSFATFPAIDLLEDSNTYLIQADLPGLSSDVVINASKNKIILAGGRDCQEREDPDARLYNIERFCGEFERSFRLPTPIDPDAIEASYKQGVLRIIAKKQQNTEKKERGTRVFVKKE